MESNLLLSTQQHDFRKGRSCITQLIEVMEDWTSKLDGNNNIDVLYMDFQKAFDSVPHERLLKKLYSYGIQGDLLGWIRNFLTNRKQRVVLNGAQSSTVRVTSGIPQGSVLGPVLFTIYINDLPNVVCNTTKLFADDAKIYSVVNNAIDQENLQSDFKKLDNWSQEWLLKFNPEKCSHLHLGKYTGTSYKLANITIKKTRAEKDLGIIIDSNLDFKEHVDSKVKKANQMLGLIKRSFSHLDKNMFLNLYKCLVRPHVEFGSPAWATEYKREKIKLENVQRRATKLIPEIKDLSYSDRLKTLGLPTLEYRGRRADIIEVYKISQGIDKIDKNKLFPKNDILQHTTRGHNQRIFKKHSYTNVRKSSFSQRIVEDWNRLPEDLIVCKTVNSFKCKLNEVWKHLPVKFEAECYGPEP